MTTPTITQMYVLTILNRELEPQSIEAIHRFIINRFGVQISMNKLYAIIWRLKVIGMIRIKEHSLAAYVLTAQGTSYYQLGVTIYRNLAAML